MSGFAPGTRVRVRDAWPELEGPAHVRTPHYVRGRTGTVLRRLGAFRNPEDLAFARPAATIPLYHVAFEQAEIWPENAPGDEFLIEIYEHWLEAA
ncbi:SH3-like domain-containing protein [Rhodovarius lipocyclicus]|jgi:hypothetical protein|uniref:SH3-like domain-containing protein n=1 Tax=Rhodovarius lipocyclicus TaxID=268410 RepID=UPI0013590C3A|nr:SH3-like domain-containing protein [Rhodovarius lipocyclicus]